MGALTDYFGVLDEDTAASLEAIVERRRAERTRAQIDRVEDLGAARTERRMRPRRRPEPAKRNPC